MAAHDEHAVIWVADDSTSERDLVERLLSATFTVRTFADGEGLIEALSQAESLPQALIVDWMMPGTSGVDVCRYLRANPVTARIPTLLLTSHDRPEDVVEGLDAGANDFVSKPFHSMELLARLRALLRTDALRQRAERAEAAASSLLESLPDALITLGPHREIVYANTEAARMLDTDANALAGRPFQEILPSLDASRIPDIARDTVSLEDVRHKDRVYAAVVRPLMLPAGLSTTVSLRDVTSHRQVEARRLDFYSVIAHELRSPLTAVSLRIQLMLRGKGGEVNEEHRQQLQLVQQRLATMDELIRDFLDLARMDAAGLKLQRAPIKLSSVVCDVAADFELIAQSSGVAVTCAAPAGNDEVFADARRLRQVVFNLLSNAIKFTKPGGAVTTEVSVDERYVTVTVKDNGLGMPPGVVNQLFNRYTRGTGEAEKIAGTGLGLMIVRQIIEAHEGVVGVESEEGAGSTFWFKLPRRISA